MKIYMCFLTRIFLTCFMYIFRGLFFSSFLSCKILSFSVCESLHKMRWFCLGRPRLRRVYIVIFFRLQFIILRFFSRSIKLWYLCFPRVSSIVWQNSCKRKRVRKFMIVLFIYYYWYYYKCSLHKYILILVYLCKIYGNEYQNR